MEVKKLFIYGWEHNGDECCETNNHDCGGLLHVDYDNTGESDWDIAMVVCDKCGFNQDGIVSGEFPSLLMGVNSCNTKV